MTRRRWRITLLAALATLGADLPGHQRSSPTTPGCAPVVMIIALVAGLGLVGRGLTRSRGLVVLAQVLVTGYVILARWTGDSFALLLPTPATLEAANSLGLQALETVSRYPVPAPLNEGVAFCLVVAVALVAIARRCHGGHVAQSGGRRAAAAHGIPHHDHQQQRRPGTAVLRRARRTLARHAAHDRARPVRAVGHGQRSRPQRDRRGGARPGRVALLHRRGAQARRRRCRRRSRRACRHPPLPARGTSPRASGAPATGAVRAPSGSTTPSTCQPKPQQPGPDARPDATRRRRSPAPAARAGHVVLLPRPVARRRLRPGHGPSPATAPCRWTSDATTSSPSPTTPSQPPASPRPTPSSPSRWRARPGRSTR